MVLHWNSVKYFLHNIVSFATFLDSPYKLARGTSANVGTAWFWLSLRHFCAQIGHNYYYVALYTLGPDICTSALVRLQVFFCTCKLE